MKKRGTTRERPAHDRIIQRRVLPPRSDPRELLFWIYRRLLDRFGPQGWWPAEDPFEVIIGAILTQNTSWKNVEKAIANLKKEGYMTPQAMAGISLDELAALIRPSGYFSIKARRIKHFLAFLFGQYGGDLHRMFHEDPALLREKLLQVKGIGPETADSILLYAGGLPVFVVDAYTKRVFSRHGFVPEKGTYQEVQDFFMGHLPQKSDLFNEYHALLVRVGKELCRKEPLCQMCPLEVLFERSPNNARKIPGC